MSVELTGIGDAGLAGIEKASGAIAGNQGKGNRFDASFGNIDVDGTFSDFLVAKMDQVAVNRQGPK